MAESLSERRPRHYRSVSVFCGPVFSFAYACASSASGHSRTVTRPETLVYRGQPALGLKLLRRFRVLHLRLAFLPVLVLVRSVLAHGVSLNVDGAQARDQSQ